MPKRQMLINYVPAEECRIAIVEDGRLEEFYQERTSNESHVGNIYKGKVCNVEPSIQAAFVDFGLERNGFLHISDLHPMYFPGDAKEETEQVGLKTPRRERPPIQKCLRRGQQILVQVLKEGIGTKGPTLTSYLSIPGRYLVMMPHMEKLGVSRKLDDDEARRNIRDVLAALNPPKGFGFIGRTRAVDATRTDLKRDLAYLQRLWKNLERRMKEVRIGELFAESDLVIRTIRDIYSSDIERIIVDDPTAARRARDFLAISNPRSGSNVLYYRDPIPLFHRYDIERQIETINAKTVPLSSGGSLIIESTEALVAIDVNSGKNRENRDAESTAYQTNIEAVDEICRQLRLRDLGGVIVNDLIDMTSASHRRAIEQRFRDNLKNDRARTRTSPISQFGILEMTRQRMRPSLKRSIYTECPACAGGGHVKSPESVVLDVMRRLALVMQRPQMARLELTVSPDVAFQLLNRKRGQLVALEQQHDKPVTVRVNGGGGIDFVALAGFDGRGGEVETEGPSRWPDPILEPAESLAEDPSMLGEEGVDLEAMVDETDGATAGSGAPEIVASASRTSGDDVGDIDEASDDHGPEASVQAAEEAHGHDADESGDRADDRGDGDGDDEREGEVPAGVRSGGAPQGRRDQHPHRAPRPPQGGRQGQGQGQGSQQAQGDSRSRGEPSGEGSQGEPGQEGGRRRRRRRRGRRGRGGQGGPGQPGQSGPPMAGEYGNRAPRPAAGDLSPDRDGAPINGAPADSPPLGDLDIDDAGPQPGNTIDPASLVRDPALDHVDEIEDSVGNRITPQEADQSQPQAGEGGGRRRRRRRGGRGRGRRGREGESNGPEGGQNGPGLPGAPVHSDADSDAERHTDARADAGADVHADRGDVAPAAPAPEPDGATGPVKPQAEGGRRPRHGGRPQSQSRPLRGGPAGEAAASPAEGGAAPEAASADAPPPPRSSRGRGHQPAKESPKPAPAPAPAPKPAVAPKAEPAAEALAPAQPPTGGADPRKRMFRGRAIKPTPPVTTVVVASPPGSPAGTGSPPAVSRGYSNPRVGSDPDAPPQPAPPIVPSEEEAVSFDDDSDDR